MDIIKYATICKRIGQKMSIFDYFTKRKIPEEVYSYKKKVMHITDTPDVSFNYIRNLVRIINPDVIIHTGDLVDNIKLEFSRHEIGIYERRLTELLRLLRAYDVEEIHIALGNHDDLDLLNALCQKNEFIHQNNVIQLKHRYGISHYYDQVKKLEADFYMFGHDLSGESRRENEKIYMNGLENIYVIDDTTGKFCEIPYPKDTDYYRQKRFKLGI